LLSIIIARKHLFLLVAVLTVALFLRFYRLEALTEFLGDQGRTGMVIYEAWQHKQLPLVGPPVLTGQLLGPFYYYLIGPAFILGKFNPLIPAGTVALFGVVSVYLLYWLISRLTNAAIGITVAGLYAVAPSIVTAERTLWEPNLIVPFVLLFLIAIYQIVEKRCFQYFSLIGLSVGILVQLHYPNLLLIALSGLFGVYIFFTKKKKESYGKICIWIIAGLVIFILTLFPFLYYEALHQWKDFRELILTLLFRENQAVAATPGIFRMIDLSGHVTNRLFPISDLRLTAAIWLILFFLSKRVFWTWFLGLWYFLGVLALSFYQGTIFEHYLNFLLPLPFIFFGLVLARLRLARLGKLWWLIPGLMIVINLRATDSFKTGVNDLTRIKLLTNAMLEQAGGQPFSFTLINSRSFSDLHYRYFLTLAESHPQPVTASNYAKLFLLCDGDNCPSEPEMRSKNLVNALCYEAHCEGSYPVIDLAKFRLAGVVSTNGSKIFSYQR